MFKSFIKCSHRIFFFLTKMLLSSFFSSSFYDSYLPSLNKNRLLASSYFLYWNAVFGHLDSIYFIKIRWRLSRSTKLSIPGFGFLPFKSFKSFYSSSDLIAVFHVFFLHIRFEKNGEQLLFRKRIVILYELFRTDFLFSLRTFFPLWWA